MTARTLRLVAYEMRAQWRGVMPSPVARAATLGFCMAWSTIFSYVVVVALRGSTRSRADAVAPLMAMFAGTALTVSMAAIARTLERPERFAMWRLAPVSPVWAVAAPIGTTALLTSAITLTFAIPAIVAAAMGHPLQAVLVAALALIIALWFLILAIAILAAIAAQRGITTAARLGRVSAGPIAALMIAALRFTTTGGQRIDPVVLSTVVLASAALLPMAFQAAAARWASALAIGPARRRSLAPRWGTPSWGRLLWRTPLAWSLLGVIPLVLSATSTTLRIALLFALVLPSAAMFHLVQWEDDCPDRQQLAPAGRRMRLGLWLHVGVPACILVSMAAIAIIPDLLPLAVFIVAAWAGPLLFLWTQRRLRAAVQIAVLVAASIFVLAGNADAQVRRPGAIAPSSATAVIKGSVIAAHTGAPLARARVRLMATADRQSITVAADGRGQFELRDLRPGRYVLTASKGGYVQMQFGQRRPFTPGAPIDLRAGETLDRIDIHLLPGGAIDGRVLDEFGEPVVDAVVMTLRTQFNGGRKRLAASGRVLTTNDRGEFHLFGLPAGTYYLSATVMTGQNAGDASGREGYAPTYFPGTVDLSSAQQIVLDEGEQRLSADVTLHLVKTVSVSGVARDADGRAFVSGTVSVVNLLSGFPMPVAAGAILGDGSFRVPNVPPGQFTITASTAGGPDGGRVTATQRLAISGEEVAGLILTAPRPSTIAGAVSLEAFETDPFPDTVQLRFVPADPVDELADAGALARTNLDRTFSLSVRGGRHHVELVNAPGWFISRVMQDDRDVSDAGVHVEPAESAANVRVVLTRAATTISGSVTDASRQASRDYTVVVFARDRLLWTFRSRYIASARPDQQGRFSIKGLPAGDYLIAALDHVEQGEGHDAEFLETIRNRAEAISIAAGETRSMALSLVRRP